MTLHRQGKPRRPMMIRTRQVNNPLQHRFFVSPTIGAAVVEAT